MLKESAKKDRFGKSVTTTTGTEIKNVLVQEQTIYSGTNDNRQVTANAVAFLFDKISSPMPQLDRHSVGKKIEYHGQQWTITNLVTNYYPTNPNKVFSYEIEVL
ncbi:putative minor capsid protein [Ligilactobacillus equi]|uniref:putative minor capsid protein n=1 Tax=Ligilactobacillus equi TaxID=137357 RepID=UPI001ED9B5ED|nr:putative minor capsid protein [Ligilactobacillus equi]